MNADPFHATVCAIPATARQTLDLAVGSEGDVTFTIGSNASVSISQIPEAMRAYSGDRLLPIFLLLESQCLGSS